MSDLRTSGPLPARPVVGEPRRARRRAMSRRVVVVAGAVLAAVVVNLAVYGLVAVTLLDRFGAWVARAALVVAPVLALGTILVMTLPADLDTVSTVTLALCHVALVPIVVAAVRALTPGTADPLPA
jgi:predicted DNA repair protein MutK